MRPTYCDECARKYPTTYKGRRLCGICIAQVKAADELAQKRAAALAEAEKSPCWGKAEHRVVFGGGSEE